MYRQTVEKNDADCGIKPEGCNVQKEEHHSGSDISNKSDDEHEQNQVFFYVKNSSAFFT